MARRMCPSNLVAATVLALGVGGIGQGQQNDTPQIAERLIIKLPSPIHALALSPDGQLLAYSDHRVQFPVAHEVVVVWDVASGREKYILKGHKAYIATLAFSRDGKTIVSACSRRNADREPVVQVIFWDVTKGSLKREMELKDAVFIRYLSPDGRVLATSAGAAETALDVWDLASGKSVSLDGHSGRSSLVTASADGRRMATIGRSPDLVLWDLPSGKKLWQRSLDPDPLDTVHAAWSPDSKTLVVCAARKTFLFDVATGKDVTDKIGGLMGSEKVGYSPTGRYVAFTNRLGIRLWSPARQQFVAQLLVSGDQGAGTPLFSDDGRIVVTTNGEIVCLWELPDLAP